MKRDSGRSGVNWFDSGRRGDYRRDRGLYCAPYQNFESWSLTPVLSGNFTPCFPCFPRHFASVDRLAMLFRPPLPLVAIVPWVTAAVVASAVATTAMSSAGEARGASERPATPFAEVTPVSGEFRGRLAEAVATVPDGVWRRLAAAGWKFRAARSVVEALPSLRGQQPRGWPAGSTWENTDAVHLAGGKLLVVGEQVRNKQGEVVAGRRVDRVLRHEVGHAYDTACGGAWPFVSSQPAFLAAYQRDHAAMNAADRAALAYYLQASAAGRQEAFAEAFAELCGGGSSPEHAAAFTRAFPQVIACVRTLLAEEK